MRKGVRVRRDWIDVRHEYLQIDGRWLAGKCKEPGFCRECNVDGEREPHPALHLAFTGKWSPATAARMVIAAHLHISAEDAADDRVIEATPFRRLSIAQDLHHAAGINPKDEDVLTARTIGELLDLALAPEERVET